MKGEGAHHNRIDWRESKSMLSEFLSAVISGSSMLTIQGSAATTEDNVKYSWNYALLLAKGPIPEALVASPLHTAMSQGKLCRFEELTRCPHEVLDGLVSVLSDKVLLVPELFLAPYTFPRLDSLLGYASGMAGPQFYQWVWEASKNEDPFAVGAVGVLVESTRLARKDGEVVGTSDAIAALAFARELAKLRNRPLIGRVEVIEAAQSCFIKGDSLLVGARVKGAVAEVMRGAKVGKLGKSAGQSPLVADFYEQCKAL